MHEAQAKPQADQSATLNTALLHLQSALECGVVAEIFPYDNCTVSKPYVQKVFPLPVDTCGVRDINRQHAVLKWCVWHAGICLNRGVQRRGAENTHH